MVKSWLLVRQYTIYQITIWTLQQNKKNKTPKHHQTIEIKWKKITVSLSSWGSQKEDAWIVLTGGLLILFKWALTLLNLSNWWGGLKVWLPCRGRHIAGAIEVVTRSSKATKEGITGGAFWEVKEANFGEWFCFAHVSSGTPSLSGCVHCCCCLLVVLWAAATKKWIIAMFWMSFHAHN